MEGYQITLLFIVLIVWGIVFIVRAFSKRGPSDEEIAKVVTSIVGGEPRDAKLPATPEEDELLDNLLRFFELSSSSRALLRILSSAEERMSYADLTAALNEALARKKRTPLPEHAVRAVIMNLVGAYLAEVKDDSVSATPAGKKVVSLITERQP